MDGDFTDQTMPDLTVAICTYHRLEPLRLTLASLAQCVAPADMTWDVLVVDNADEPAVRAMVEGFGDRLAVRYVAEATTGTSHARNRAVHELEQAGVPIVLFTDDDVTFDASWLALMAAAISSQPGCDFWGGRVEPVWPPGKDVPRWFDVQRCAMLGDTIVQYRRGKTPRSWDAAQDPPFYTANLALRVKAVAAAGYFDIHVGHRGGVRMGMEDSLMVRSIAAMGGRGWYAGDAVVFHPVPEERLTRGYARRFAWRQGFASVHQLRAGLVGGEESADRANGRRSGHVPRWLYRAAMGGAVTGVGGWLAGLATGDPGRAFAGEFQTVFNVSKLWHALRRRDEP